MRRIFNILTATGFILLFGTAGASDRGMEFSTVIKFTAIAFVIMGVGLFGNYLRSKR